MYDYNRNDPSFWAYITSRVNTTHSGFEVFIETFTTSCIYLWFVLIIIILIFFLYHNPEVRFWWNPIIHLAFVSWHEEKQRHSTKINESEKEKNSHGLDFLFSRLPSNVASPVTAPAVASIVCLFRGLPSKTKSGHRFC